MTSQEKRNEARQARRLAEAISDREARKRLLAYADELEAQADALDHPSSPTTVQDQQQTQQQGPAVRDDHDKE